IAADKKDISETEAGFKQSPGYPADSSDSFFLSHIERSTNQILEELNQLHKMLRIYLKKERGQYITTGYFAEFKVGKEIIFIGPDNFFYSSKIIGWEEGKYILCETNKNIDKLFTAHELVTLKYAHNDKVIEFKSRLFSESEPVSNLILITYPKEYVEYHLRKYRRIEVKIPCSIKYKNIQTLEGTIVDFSINGMLICLNYPLDISDRIILSFVLPNGKPIENVEAIVKNIRDKNKYGLQFDQVSKLMFKRIEEFFVLYDKIVGNINSIESKVTFSGTFNDIKIIDLVQLMSSLRKDVTIEILSDPVNGSIYLKEGEVINASNENKEGFEAFYKLLDIEKGEFFITEINKDIERKIFKKTDVLLLDSVYQKDVKNIKAF
ncbi:MAG: DUF4388 domain-containing protein, partial [bacterium]